MSATQLLHSLDIPLKIIYNANMPELTNIITSYIEEQQTIYFAIILILTAIQSIINLFVIIDYIKSNSNTKLLIATTLIILMSIFIILFIV